MKQYKYTVKFKNGFEKVFYTNGFSCAIILAMAYAINQAWDRTILHVVDEKGFKITDITEPQFNAA